MRKIISNSEEETKKIAKDLAARLKKGDVIGLIGELGSGKTTFVQGLADGIGVDPRAYVHSPSFTLVNEYSGRIPLYHIDLYRLGSKEEIESAGLDDYLYGSGVSVVEWAERLTEEDRRTMTVIRFSIEGTTKRVLEILPRI